ncbi:hypothetical protein D0860_00318 [Hortaea werneckii]|uniref:NAD-specific glutamate dehydrogenase n=1 Tax=Hortaea werneckii TaxID=91943 RepID=A0A3M7HWT2_HORWE|nr:hypothetical protein D0860_00318 [Hortaea werneckii]
MRLVDLLDGRAVVAALAAWGSTSAAGATWHATLGTLAIDLDHDRLLLLALVFVLGGGLVVVDPGDGLVDLGLELLLLASLDLLGDLLVLDRVLEGVGVGLKAVLGLDTGSLGLVLLLVLLGLSKHTLDLLLGETALVVGDDNLVGLASALLESGDVHDSVGVKVEGDLNLRNTTRRRRDTSELELAHQVVVFCTGAFTLEDLDEHTRLVVGEGREDLRLLGRDGGVTLDQRGHDTTGSLDTERQRRNVEQQDLVGRLAGGVARQNSGLHGGTVGDGLVGVDGLAWLLTVEEVGDELLHLRDTSGATNQDDLVDGRLVDLRVAEDTLNWLHGGAEEVLAKLLETGTGDGGVEVDTLEERVDLNRGLSRRGQSPLRALTSSAQTTESASVGGQVLLVFPLELINEVVDKTIVEVLATKVGVTSSGLDLEDTLLNGKERHIESATTQVEDEHVALTLVLLVQTVGDSGSGRLVDDTEDVQTGNKTGVLGNERGRGAVALVVGDDLNAVISEDTDTGVGGTQVDTDCWGHDERFFWV